MLPRIESITCFLSDQRRAQARIVLTAALLAAALFTGSVVVTDHHTGETPTQLNSNGPEATSTSTGTENVKIVFEATAKGFTELNPDRGDGSLTLTATSNPGLDFSSVTASDITVTIAGTEYQGTDTWVTVEGSDRNELQVSYRGHVSRPSDSTATVTVTVANVTETGVVYGATIYNGSSPELIRDPPGWQLDASFLTQPVSTRTKTNTVDPTNPDSAPDTRVLERDATCTETSPDHSENPEPVTVATGSATPEAPFTTWSAPRNGTIMATPESDRARDRDGDGFSDALETADKRVSGPVARGDPMHKDVFVEISYGPGAQLSSREKRRMQETFADAPVCNPDGTRGIRLHIIEDATATQSLTTAGYDSFWRNDLDRETHDTAGHGTYHLAIVQNLTETEKWAGVHRTGRKTAVLEYQNKSTTSTGPLAMHELGHVLGIGPEDGAGVDSHRVSVYEYPSVMNYKRPESPRYDHRAMYGYSDGSHGARDINGWQIVAANNPDTSNITVSQSPRGVVTRIDASPRGP